MPKKQIVFADLLTAPRLRWPTRGDRLFAAASGDAPEATIHQDKFTRFVFMMDGYKRAADILLDEAICDHIARSDLIYPIIFCYRQFLELSLKWQIHTYGSFCEIPKPANNHKLKELFESFRKICKCFGAADDDALDAVGECIMEFDLMDPNSFTFRYPDDHAGSPYPVTTNRIDLGRVKDVMDSVHNFFKGCDGYFNSGGGGFTDAGDNPDYSGF